MIFHWILFLSDFRRFLKLLAKATQPFTGSIMVDNDLKMILNWPTIEYDPNLVKKFIANTYSASSFEFW